MVVNGQHFDPGRFNLAKESRHPVNTPLCGLHRRSGRRVRLKPDGTRWRTGLEVKGKLANGVGSQYSDTTSEHGVSSITNADAHNSAASSRVNWRPRRFKWTRPFRRKTKSGFCACAIMFQTQSTKTKHCQLWFKFTNTFQNTPGGRRNRNHWPRQARDLWIRNSEVVKNFVFARVGCEFCPGIRVTWRILIVVVTTDHLLRHAVHFVIRNYPTTQAVELKNFVNPCHLLFVGQPCCRKNHVQCRTRGLGLWDWNKIMWTWWCQRIRYSDEATGWKIRDSKPDRLKRSCCFLNFQTGSGSHLFYSVGTGVVSWELKRSSASRIEVKNAWRCTCTPPICLRVVDKASFILHGGVCV